MRTTVLTFLVALLTLTGAPARGAEALDILLQKRTLDSGVPEAETLAGALAELAARYKAKYGEELPLFISAALLPDPAAPKPKPVQAPTIPGTDVPAEPLTARTRIGHRIHNVPLVEILKYYANFFKAAHTIRGDVILFHKPSLRLPSAPTDKLEQLEEKGAQQLLEESKLLFPDHPVGAKNP